MKKILTVLIAAAVLAGSLVMTGCGLRNAIQATHNHWYKYNKEGGMDVPLGEDSSEGSTSAATLSGSEFYVYFNAEKGLTVAIQKKTTTTASIAGGLLEQEVEIVTGGTKQYSTTEFGSGRWAALVSTGKFDQCSTPKIVAEPNSCVDISTALGNGIQWKKVLRNILINQLLGE